MTERLVESVCWCSREYTMVPVEWVSEGRTNTCTYPGCAPGCPIHDDGTDAFDEPAPELVPIRRINMNRFTASDYDPRAESSASVPEAVRSQYPGDLLLDATAGLCPCGCGEPPKSKKSQFGMGHDIRLRGKLARAHAAGAKVVLVSDGEPVRTIEALEYAATFSTAKLDWRASIAESAARIASRSARTEPEREVLRDATRDEQPEGRKLQRVGRWDRTGKIVAIYTERDGHTLYDYVDGDGVRRQVRSVDGELSEIGVETA